MSELIARVDENGAVHKRLPTSELVNGFVDDCVRCGGVEHRGQSCPAGIHHLLRLLEYTSVPNQDSDVPDEKSRDFVNSIEKTVALALGSLTDSKSRLPPLDRLSRCRLTDSKN